jgi:hypothetical protein
VIRDRVGDVTFGPDRRRCAVGDRRLEQPSRTARPRRSRRLPRLGTRAGSWSVSIRILTPARRLTAGSRYSRWRWRGWERGHRGKSRPGGPRGYCRTIGGGRFWRRWGAACPWGRLREASGSSGVRWRSLRQARVSRTGVLHGADRARAVQGGKAVDGDAGRRPTDAENGPRRHGRRERGRGVWYSGFRAGARACAESAQRVLDFRCFPSANFYRDNALRHRSAPLKTPVSARFTHQSC